MNLDSAVLYSNNIDDITAFYKDIVGLVLEYQQGDDFVSFIFPNGARLSIKKAKEDREVPGTQTVFISVENIEEKYHEMKTKRVEIRKELTTKSYGMEFSILDPDKNKVEFIKRN